MRTTLPHFHQGISCIKTSTLIFSLNNSNATIDHKINTDLMQQALVDFYSWDKFCHCFVKQSLSRNSLSKLKMKLSVFICKQNYRVTLFNRKINNRTLSG